MRTILLLGTLTLGVACAVLGPADRAGVANDAATIERCQEVGRACKAADAGNCYGRYDACMRDAGLR